MSGSTERKNKKPLIKYVDFYTSDISEMNAVGLRVCAGFDFKSNRPIKSA